MSANLAQYTPLLPLNQTATQDLSIPTRFTFPYYYTPHPTCELAMLQLQQSLIDCGVNETSQGNLYAVLLVQNPTTQELGYVSAFSGLQLDSSLASQLTSIAFVPSAFDGQQWQVMSAQNLSWLPMRNLILWQPIAGYQEGITPPLKPGSSHPLILWVRERLSLIDLTTQPDSSVANEPMNQWQVISPTGQESIGFNEYYDPLLAQKVALFQTKMRLKADQLIGLKTLLALQNMPIEGH